MKKLVVLFFYTWLFADDSYWEGTIGKNKIYMELGCDIEKEISNGNSCASLRYFYGSHLIDIYVDAFDGKQKISKMAFAKMTYDWREI